MKKLGKLLMILALIINQINWPLLALAQEVTPTIEPTQIPETLEVVESVEVGVTTVTTGDVVAVASITNVVNTTSQNSELIIHLPTETNVANESVDLNTEWLSTKGLEETMAVIEIGNSAEITNTITIEANSGDNTVTGSDNSSIVTGDAIGIANIVNLLNINLVDSKLFVGIMNYEGETLGDLILPNPDIFLLTEKVSSDTNQISTFNEAIIDNKQVVSADTGNNEIKGDTDSSSMSTGNALAISNTVTTANVNFINQNQMLLALNLLGTWEGNIYNWQRPGTEIPGCAQEFVISTDNNTAETPKETVTISNTATIENTVNIKANTGGNLIEDGGGDAVIETGKAIAISNITNLVNLNLINSNLFYGLVNITGNWKGNVIFAYPDLTMSVATEGKNIRVGDETEISVNYSNIGYDQSGKSQVSVYLPDTVEYLSDSSGLNLTKNGNKLSWQIDNLLPKSDNNFVIKVKRQIPRTTFRLVKPAIAAETEVINELIINGQISTFRTEVTTNNNSSTTVIQAINIAKTEDFVTSEEDENKNTNNNLQPKLVITEKNNVHDWVNNKDVVTFEINGKNEGEATVFGSFLKHILKDSRGNILAENKINIGKVEVGSKGKVTFGIPLNFNLTGDQNLTSETVWVGYNQAGDEVKSNMTQSNFVYKNYQSQLLKVAEVKATSQPEVLGIEYVQSPKIDLIPYLLLFILSSFWILRQTKKWLEK